MVPDLGVRDERGADARGWLPIPASPRAPRRAGSARSPQAPGAGGRLSSSVPSVCPAASPLALSPELGGLGTGRALWLLEAV